MMNRCLGRRESSFLVGSNKIADRPGHGRRAMLVIVRSGCHEWTATPPDRHMSSISSQLLHSRGTFEKNVRKPTAVGGCRRRDHGRDESRPARQL